MSDQQVIQILQKYSDAFNLDSILGRIIRELCWNITMLLAYIIDAISQVTDKLFQLDIFYNNTNVITFINSFKPLIIVLFGIAICGAGYQIMFSQNKQFRKIGVNVLVAIAVIILLPTAMDKMNDITNIGVATVKGNPSNIANQIIKENTTDLLLYDKANFNDTAIKQLTSDNQIDKKNIRYINPTSIIEPDFFNTIGIQNQDVFKNRLTISEDGKISIEQLNQGWLTFWKEYYYRYSIDFLNIIIALAVMGATLIFTCFKLGRLIFELGYNKLLALIVAPADINSGQRTKQIIQNIVSIFIVTFLIAVLLQFYVLFIGMCTKIKGMQYLILIVAGSFAVIDGPNMVEKIFGIDAGLHSGFKTMMGAFLAGKAIAGGAGTIGNAVKNIAGAGGNAGGALVGAGAGAISGFAGLGNNNGNDNKNLYKDMEDNNKNGDNKGKSLYDEMNGGNNTKEVDDKNEPSSADPVGGGDTKEPINDVDNKDIDRGNGNSGQTQRPSLYKEMDGNGSNGIRQKPAPIYSHGGSQSSPIGSSSSGSSSSPVGGNPNMGNTSVEPSNGGGSIPESIPVTPISSNAYDTEPLNPSMSDNGGNNDDIVTVSTGEPINDNGNSIYTGSNKEDENLHKETNRNSPYDRQTIGDYTKNKIREKVQNNNIYKQTVKSYKITRNTVESMKNKKK